MIIAIMTTTGEGLKNAQELIRKAGLEQNICLRTVSMFHMDKSICAFFKTEKPIQAEGEIFPGVYLSESIKYPIIPDGWKRLNNCESEILVLPDSLLKVIEEGTQNG